MWGPHVSGTAHGGPSPPSLWRFETVRRGTPARVALTRRLRGCHARATEAMAMRWRVTWTAARAAAHGNQRHGERRRLTGGEWYGRVAGVSANLLVQLRVVEDKRGDRRRGFGGGGGTGSTATALGRCSGETEVAPRSPLIARCQRCRRCGSSGLGLAGIARRSSGGGIESTSSSGG